MVFSAVRRLMTEYKQMTQNPTEGILAAPINENNYLEWKAFICGPQGTCYEGGLFSIHLTFPNNYPLSPPIIKFISDMFHPNVYPDGRICISILHAPEEDMFGYENIKERWSPVQSIEKILLSVISMLAEPNAESGANIDAAKMWREDRKAFEEKARECVRKSLNC